MKHNIPYSAKLWWDKTLVNRSFQSFDKENIRKFKCLIFSYLSEGKILANDVCFAKFGKAFHARILLYAVFHNQIIKHVILHL